MQNGILLSIITVLIWALDNVFSRYAMTHLHAEPVVFICMAIFISATVLILVAGPGKGGLDTVKQPHTWVYGLFQVVMNIAEMIALLYVTSTEVNFICRINILFTLMATWLFLRRKPQKVDLLASLLIVGGVVFVASGIAPDKRLLVLFCIFWVSLFSAARTIIVETHPASAAATGVKEQCRVAGYVLMVTSFLFLGTFMGTAWLKSVMSPAEQAAFPLLATLPALKGFIHYPTMLAALILGGTLLPLGMYFYFYSTKVAKSETFTMVSALLPFFTYIVEAGASTFNFLDIKNITGTDLVAGAIITSASFLMIWGRHRTLVSTTKKQ